MNITILGIGGFDNPGFPFNAMMIDGHILLEAPPDILQSLMREGIDLGSIGTIYLSHTHGDHVFGMPFLLFNIWRRCARSEPVRIIGPRDVRDSVLGLCSLAIHPDHPLLAWIETQCIFETIDEGSRLGIGDYSVETYRMVHARETYGLGFYRDGILCFQYVPDTKWDDSLIGFFAKGARLVLCDVNGSGEPGSIHMGIGDLERNLAGIVGDGTRILGTHVSRLMGNESTLVDIAEVGMRLEV